jgi:hypothetical protein
MTTPPEINLATDKETEKDVIAPNLTEKSGEAVEEDTKEEVQESSEETDDSTRLEKWNYPRVNMYRYLTTLFCFINMGMNDAAYGVSILRASRRCTLTYDRP